MRLDPETGLYYDRARYYDALEGRFISRDPYGYATDMNMYEYVMIRPTDFADPTGTLPERKGSGAYKGAALTASPKN